MRERKKRIVFIGVVLLVIVILAATPIILPRMRPLKAVYLEDENGKTISEKKNQEYIEEYSHFLERN
ncbi:MAG TPA: hypothetical protein H9765_09030 [Candidatus Mediterraneibacter intestinigallinarum]|nr:hypothetical protein [Candidatus Mediterraneibacter intestinigallinarum]